MKKLFTLFGIALCFFLLSNQSSFAQLNGTYAIPTDYATISAAITALNTSGVSGPVVFNVLAGHTETAVNLVLSNTTPSATNTVTFQKSGAGANPLITAGTGTGTVDGVIEFGGMDYVTFDGIDIQENAANTTSTTRMEWGYGVFVASTINASKYITIKNCNISLTSLHTTTPYSNGVYIRYHTPTSSTAVTPASTDGMISDIKIYSNNISNVVNGVYVYGNATAANYINNIQIGVEGGNTITASVSGAYSVYGVYAIYGNNIAIANNTFTSTGGSTLYGMYLSTGTNSNVDIYNNTVTVNGQGTTSSIYGISNAMGATGTTNTVNIYNNIIENCTYTTATTGVFYGIYQNASAYNANIYNNQVRNNTKPGTGTFYGIYAYGSVVNISNVYGNTIRNNSNTGVGTMYLLYSNPASGTTTNMYSNAIYSNTCAGSTIYGIRNALSATANIYKNNIYDLTSTSTGGIYGIDINSGTNVNVYNNFISDLKTPNATAGIAIAGIYVSSTSATTVANLFYNSVYLNATSSGSGFGVRGVYASTTPTLDMRNNIIVTESTPTGTGLNVAYMRNSATLTTYASTSNNNCFYAGTPDATHLIFMDGTYQCQSMASYKTAVAPRDAASFRELPPFVNVSSAPYDLHLQTTVETQCESGGTPVSSPITITDDYDGNTRNASKPDVGADEGNFTPAPIMNYVSSTTTQVTGYAYSGQTNQHIIRIEIVTSGSLNPLEVTQFTVNANGTTNISDINGSTAKIYYTGSSSTFNTSILFGAETPTTADFSVNGTQALVAGTNYFWLAYDVSAGANSGNFIDGECNMIVLGSTEIPDVTAPAGYKTIIGPMSGTYYVGQGQSSPNFVTITDAFSNLQSRGISGAVNLVLTNSSGVPYNVANGETFPLTLSPVTGASSTNTITIKPNSGVTPVISESTTSVLKLNGADYIIIDGSNSGGTDRSLTIENTNTSATTAAIWFSSGASVGTGATNNTVKNCIIKAGTNTATTYCIISCGSTLGAVSGYDNDNNTIQNNAVSRAYYGIYSYAASTGVYDNLNINNNIIGSSNASEYITAYGIYGYYLTSANINGNQIFNLISSNTCYGIYGYYHVSSTISNNQIYNFNNTSTAYGIYQYYMSNSTITGNTIRDFSNTGTAYGLYCYTMSGSTISQNEIYNFISDQSHYGMYFTTSNTNLVLSKNKIHTFNIISSTSTTLYAIGIYSASTTNTNIQYDNNVIYNLKCYGSASYGYYNVGIRIAGGSDHKLFYNSISMTGANAVASTMSTCIYVSTATTNIEMRDNILYNAKTGTTPLNYLIYTVASTNFLASGLNYNDYYTTGSVFGYYQGTSVANFTAWQTASGQDANSINLDPIFNSETILQPKLSSPALAAGTPITGLTTDILGVTRNATNPSIGAYENGLAIPKSISSITINQASTAATYQNAANQEILRMNFNVAGEVGTLFLNSIVVNSANQNDADVSTVKLYRTTTTTFSTDNQIGTGQVFSGGTATFSSIGYDLPAGMNYIWVAYDLSASSTIGNYVDAQINTNQINVAGNTYPSSDQNPAGVRYIGINYDFEPLSDQDFTHSPVAGTLDEWQRGTPSGGTGYPTTTHSGVKCWGTNLAGDYGNGVNAALYSPVYKANMTTVGWSFWEYYNTEATFDYCYPEYKINNGAWTAAVSGYSGVGTTWTQRSFNISAAVNDLVQFRWRFTSDADVVYAGWYVDDAVFSGITQGDFVPPTITYSTLGNTTVTTDRIFQATISDNSGVPTSGSLQPRVYYKKFTSGSWFSSQGVLVSGNGNSGTWDMTIVSSDLGGVFNGDSIFYYVIAQDIASPVNIASNPSGVIATDVNTITTHPANPNVYKIVRAPLSGLYSVGINAFNKISGKNLYYKSETRKVIKEITNEETDVISSNDVQTKTNVKINDKQNNNISSKSTKFVEVEETVKILYENDKPYTGPDKIYFNNSKFGNKGKSGQNLDNPDGMYTTITAAITDLNERGIDGAITFVFVDNDYPTETLPLTINQVTGASTTNTVIFQPNDFIGTVTISGSNATSIFLLNGADYVTIDGRPYGNTTPKQLLIRNTSGTAPAVKFQNDSRQSAVKYCVLESDNSTVSASGSNSGVVNFGSTTGSYGNDSITISYCDIRDRSDVSGTPICCIYGSGLLGAVDQYNSNIVIDNNNIFNFYRDQATTLGGILVYEGCTDWIISNNSFYQTTSRTFTTAASVRCIWNNNTGMNNMIVEGNYFGGSSPNCGGAPMTLTNNTSAITFYGMRLFNGASVATSVQGNTISNISFTTTLTAANTQTFCPIILPQSASFINVGNITGNTIGSGTGTGNIQVILNGGAYTSVTAGIYHYGAVGAIQNNVIGSITVSGTATGVATVAGIYHTTGAPSTPFTISNNTIGSLVTANSIQNTTTTLPMDFSGIRTATAGTGALIVDNNVIINISDASTTTTSTMRGIYHTGTNTAPSFTNNTIQELSSISTNVSGRSSASPCVIGISTNTAVNTQVYTGNIITGLRSTTTSAVNTSVFGIGMLTSTSGGTISRNRIYNLTNVSTGATPYIIGVNLYYGTWTIGNNQITLTNGEATDNYIKNNNQNESDNLVNRTDIKGDNFNSIKTSVRNIVTNNSINNNTKSNITETNVKQNDSKIVYMPQSDVETDYSKYIDIVPEENNIKEISENLDFSTNGILIYGIFDDNTSSYTANYYYNSVYIGGSASTGTNNSYAFYRNSTSVPVLRNNLYYNGRTNSGASGKHYAIGSGGTAAININYNSYVSADASTLAYYNALDQTFAQWKTSTGQDAISYGTTSSIISAANLFNSISGGNLNILSGNSEAWLVSGKGTYVAGQNTDFGGVDSRSVSIAGGVTDIGSDEFSATPPNCPLAIESGAPASGTTTYYTIFGRTLVAIDWGTGGSSYPDGMNVIYYSGVTPPGSSGNNSYSYCNVIPSSGTLTGATYDITNYFTDAETYTIVNPNTDTRVSKYTAGEWWVYTESGTGNLQTELNWSGLWAKVRGLSTFSYFAFSDITNPLPVHISAFTSSVNGRDVKLFWTTESELNNMGFEIQRINYSEINIGNWTKIGYIKSNGNSPKPSNYSFEDKKLNSGKYKYRLKQIDNLGASRYFGLNNVIDVALPTVFRLSQNYPNPFNPATKIDFELPFDSRVRIVVYDILGREAKILLNSETKQAGFYTVDLNATNLASGTYFYRMIANSQGKDFIFTKKMTIVK